MLNFIMPDFHPNKKKTFAKVLLRIRQSAGHSEVVAYVGGSCGFG